MKRFIIFMLVVLTLCLCHYCIAFAETKNIYKSDLSWVWHSNNTVTYTGGLVPASTALADVGNNTAFEIPMPPGAYQHSMYFNGTVYNSTGSPINRNFPLNGVLDVYRNKSGSLIKEGIVNLTGPVVFNATGFVDSWVFRPSNVNDNRTLEVQVISRSE